MEKKRRENANDLNDEEDSEDDEEVSDPDPDVLKPQKPGSASHGSAKSKKPAKGKRKPRQKLASAKPTVNRQEPEEEDTMMGGVDLGASVEIADSQSEDDELSDSGPTSSRSRPAASLESSSRGSDLSSPPNVSSKQSFQEALEEEAEGEDSDLDYTDSSLSSLDSEEE